MKVTGIIAEYNPFHKGHAYHIQKAKELTGADYIIVVMSGDFTQRGMPAILDKYTRARMALACGADLVLELPVRFACASAEFFAGGAVSLLDRLGVVDSLCFGSECGDAGRLQKAASVLAEAEASESFRNTLREGIRNGLSFPAARAKALETQENGIGELFTLPNNILGIEYCRALLHLNSPVRPVTVLRKGAGYHEEALHDEQNEAPGYSSAFSIRQALQQSGSFDTVRGSLPEETLEIWEYCLKNSGIVSEKDFSPLLRYRLLMEAENGFSSYADVTPDFSDRLKKNLDQFTGWHDFCLLQNSRDMTYTRISRCLCHILLGLSQEKQEESKHMAFASYARPLGFRRSVAPLLQAVKQNSSIPFLSKLADARQFLSPFAASLLEEDIKASHIYQTVVSGKYEKPFLNEYRRQIPIL